MSGSQIGRVEQAYGTVACIRGFRKSHEHSVSRSARIEKINLLLSNAVPAAFGEWDAIRSHDLQLLGIRFDPTSGFEEMRRGEDGGVVMHPVCGHREGSLASGGE